MPRSDAGGGDAGGVQSVSGSGAVQSTGGVTPVISAPLLDSATSAATPDTLAKRDAAGRLAVADPLAATDAANLRTVQSVAAAAASAHQGTATIDFGVVPGSTLVQLVVADPAVTAGAYIEVWMMSEASADHSDVEHQVVPMKLTAGAIVPGVSFTIYAFSDWSLIGTWNVRWKWS